MLEPLQKGKLFAFRPYNCSTQELSEKVLVKPHALTIVEGVYSLHPSLSEAYDLKIFLELDPGEQSPRLIQRDERLYSRFVQEWIPMEKKYFTTFEIPSQCDLKYAIIQN